MASSIPTAADSGVCCGLLTGKSPTFRCVLPQASTRAYMSELWSMRSRQAIRRWKESATTRYTYTSKPIASEEANGKTVVTSRLTGDFPGSPVDLRYVFELDGDRIASLKIMP